MPGTLYIVATPIGNLGDITLRARDTLAAADFIAAEDTRVTRRLLSHLGLHKPLVSYREHNEQRQAGPLLDRIAAGESCALCTDAGTPAISDPGEAIVREAQARGIPVVPLPGASAAVTALCASGQDTRRFCFEGFLSQNRAQRRSRLAALQNEERTLLFYEAPHKLLRTLEDLAEAFGPERGVTLCRELTKLHEEITPTTLGEALATAREAPPRGEYVLVVAGAPAAVATPSLSPAEAAAEALALAEAEGLPASEAARRLAAQSGLPKSAVYREMTAQKALQTPPEGT